MAGRRNNSHEQANEGGHTPGEGSGARVTAPAFLKSGAAFPVPLQKRPFEAAENPLFSS
jgi:hypothetical protein